jgi:type I restriction enzyme, R subunit
VKAYEHFEDPEWDGEPLEPEEKPDKDGDGPKEPKDPKDPDEDEPEDRQVVIKLADGKARTIQHMAATTFWSPDGKPMSAAEFIKRLYGEIPELFKDEDELRTLWGEPDTRKALLEGLAERGYGDGELTEIGRMIDAEKSDLFDVLAYIAYALAPITRQDRVDSHKAHILSQYDDKLQAFIDFVLAQYVKEGVGELDKDKLPGLLRAKYYNINDGAAELGGIPKIRDAFVGFQQHLYG